MLFLDALLPDRPRRTYERATGLTGEALAVARRRGTDAGHIVAVATSPVDPCRDLQALMDGAPVTSMLGYLAILAVMAIVFIPLGIFVFGWAERYAKRTGKLKRVG